MTATVLIALIPLFLTYYRLTEGAYDNSPRYLVIRTVLSCIYIAMQDFIMTFICIMTHLVVRPPPPPPT